jgi:hypothetical protein
MASISLNRSDGLDVDRVVQELAPPTLSGHQQFNTQPCAGHCNVQTIACLELKEVA